MKTSKYLIIALVAFVLVAELIFSIDALNAAKTGRNAYPDHIKRAVSKKQDIQPFLKVKISPNIAVNIDKAEKYQIGFTCYKDSTVVLPKYRIENGVLHIDTIPKNRVISVTVYAPKIESIVGMEGNKLTLYDFSFSELNIDINKGRIWDYGRDTIKCKQLKIKAIESRVFLNGMVDIDNVDLNLTHSSVHFEKGKKGTLRAVLNKRSRIDAHSFNNIQVQKDASSKLFVR